VDTQRPETKASREPTWDELDDHGKIERMRQIIKQQQYKNIWLDAIVRRLLKHKHVDGEIVTPMERCSGEGGSSMRSDYF